MIKILNVKKSDCEALLGTFLDENHYDTLIDYDCDVYHNQFGVEENSEKNIVLKFRKNYFTPEQQAGAYDGLKDAAKQSQNRGIAAGPKGSKLLGRDWLNAEQAEILKFLNKIETKPSNEDIDWVKANAKKNPTPRGLVWLSSEKERTGFNWDKWLNEIIQCEPDVIHTQVDWVMSTLISDTSYANPVDSGIAGWFGRYPRIPYGRPSAYTFYNKEKFKLSYPFLQQLSKGFKELLPNRWQTQMNCANKIDPNFRVPNTPFTTITVNKNFRTAAHRDAGDLEDGFSNLTVITKNTNYDGGYLILPEIRAAVNVRPGDLLLVGNHNWIHGNTPITGKPGFERISVVCYFREDMLELGSREYEDARFDFVESRRKNSNHELYWKGWNGISSGMWESEEWYNFLRSRNQLHLIKQYHPKALEKSTTIEEFFYD